MVLPAPSLPFEISNLEICPVLKTKFTAGPQGLPGNFVSWEKASQHTPGTTDSEKLTGCSQKPKCSALKTVCKKH